LTQPVTRFFEIVQQTPWQLTKSFFIQARQRVPVELKTIVVGEMHGNGVVICGA